MVRRLDDSLQSGHNMRETPKDAARILKAVTLAPERADYRDRWYFKDASQFMRIAKQRSKKTAYSYHSGIRA
jgi:hypothetical protein